MLEKAKESLSGDNFEYIHQTFESFIDEPVEASTYDFICSSNAIHHLDHTEKEQLYNKMYKALKSNGLFINIDPVLPNSSLSEKYQFQLWVDWINNNLKDHGSQDKIGKYDHTPNSYKDKDENKPSKLSTQLSMLENVGFKDVDCFYKYGVFAVFGGTK